MAHPVLHKLYNAFIAAVSTLDYSLSPSLTLKRLRAHKFTLSDTVYLFHIVLATFWLTLLSVPPFPFKLAIPLLYGIALLIPLTSQFFLPATPIFAYLLTFFASRFIPHSYRPPISVLLLPTLESVLYGANISDILTRFTHPVLDIIAWIPYGVGHFSAPFVLAAFLWLFAPKPALPFFGKAFGYLNLLGVIFQILLPCAAPWYELIYGLTPADYSMKGSPGGLARIDALFNSNGYTNTFSNAPVVFGAFPSLHSACATMEALFVSHFFGFTGPNMKRNWIGTAAWTYTAILYWATMYLTHHYLVDVVGGACMATGFFYFFLPTELNTPPPPPASRNKYELYDIENEAGYKEQGPYRRPHSNTLSSMSSEEPNAIDAGPSPRASADGDEYAREPSDPDEEEDIGYRPPTSAVPFLSRALQSRATRDRGTYKKVEDRAPASRVRSQHHHKRTASIASLLGADERTDEGWGGRGIKMPPAPIKLIPSPMTTSHSGARTPRSAGLRGGRSGDVTPRGESHTVGDP